MTNLIKELDLVTATPPGNYKPLTINESEEEKLLGDVGFQDQLNFNKEKQNEYEIVKKYGSAIRYEDLKKIGKRYAMVLTRPDLYKGLAGPETATKIKAFAEKNGISGFQNFFILSPIESSDQWVQYVNSRKEAIRAARDPVLLYKDEKNYYHIVDTWGKDMNIFRRIKSFFSLRIEIVAAIGALLFALSWFGVASVATGTGLMVSSMIIGTVLMILLGILAVVAINEQSRGNGDKIRIQFFNEYWDKMIHAQAHYRGMSRFG